VFLKLIQVGRGDSTLKISKSEQIRMRNEYIVDKITPLVPLKACLNKLKTTDKINLVLIMSISVESFGHVWVIEKKHFNGIPRYHHYQSALNSHMLIDFIESMDYGADPMKSLNVEHFFNQLASLINYKDAWTEEQYRLFVQMFAFIPVTPITRPEMGFSWTWASYQ
jgi:hypothetical protein